MSDGDKKPIISESVDKKPMIFESPDGGKTVYAREFGAHPSTRVQIIPKPEPKNS